jgi:hypothetical protein
VIPEFPLPQRITTIKRHESTKDSTTNKANLNTSSGGSITVKEGALHTKTSKTSDAPHQSSRSNGPRRRKHGHSSSCVTVARPRDQEASRVTDTSGADELYYSAMERWQHENAGDQPWHGIRCVYLDESLNFSSQGRSHCEEYDINYSSGEHDLDSTAFNRSFQGRDA